MVVQGFEVFLELKGGVELRIVRMRVEGMGRGRTSPSGMRGGPAAMSADLVPGWILRLAFASIVLCSIESSVLELLIAGDLGPICISVGGGGLGSRGELGGSAMMGVDVVEDFRQLDIIKQ